MIKEKELKTIVKEDKMRETKEIITSIIKKFGISPNIQGYYYIREATLKYIDDLSYLNEVTKRLYPEIAKKYRTTPTRVERAIRTAIEMAWNRADSSDLLEFFTKKQVEYGKRPTNSEFIAALADRIYLIYI